MTSTTNLTGPRKAAVLIAVLGEEAASGVFKSLPEADLQRLTEAISELGRVEPETAKSGLEEFHKLSVTQEYMAEGGPDYAQRLLIKAFGEEGAKTLMEQVSRAQELSAGKLDSLQKCDPLQLAKFLERERTGTVVIGKDVKLGAAAILHGSLSIAISTEF